VLFNSLEFGLFFVLVTTAYYLLPQRFQWMLLLAASCAFYMAFVPVYILILFATIIIDYVAAIYIERSAGPRARAFLILSVISTCLVLFVFKYFNFFATNLDSFARAIHWNYSMGALKLILPIGLSFHTFQSLSYVVEVYRRKQKPEKHFGIYALYVMFYPQLVAGPIERPQNLLHQFREAHRFNYDQVKSGLLLMAWGFFKKLVIADRLALYSNYVFNDPTQFEGFTLIAGLVFFAYQIYCDFSGYTDIARGCARVMGFELMRNFDRPYSSQSIAEFWKRWHISLSTWFRDYVYIPLGGSRSGTLRLYRNLLVVFAISGLWHGANWTFIIWGLLNGVYLVLELASKPWRERICRSLGLTGKEKILIPLRIAITFGLTLIAWTLFRADSLHDALYILGHLWNLPARQSVTDGGFEHADWAIALLAIGALELCEYAQRHHGVSQKVFAMPTPVRWGIYYCFVFILVFFGVFNKSSFIYFQF
jgi:alginate O-acetyltransferase complex protein AlgI